MCLQLISAVYTLNQEKIPYQYTLYYASKNDQFIYYYFLLQSNAQQSPATVYQRRVSGTPDSRSLSTSGRTSPLKRFRQAKESIYKTFGLITSQLHQVQEVLTESHGPEGEGRTSALLDKTKGIEEILARDHMKVKIIILLL